MSCGEQTHHYSSEQRKTGITMMNTRIIEIFNKNIDQPVLEVFNSYFEFTRLGSYHGYWTMAQAEKIIEYLQSWIEKQKALGYEIKELPGDKIVKKE